MDASSYARTRVLPDGTAGTLNATLGSMGIVGPINMRAVGFPNSTFHFSSQSSKLFAMVGARSPATAGALEIGLVD